MLPSSFKFAFKGLAVGSLRYNAFLVSKKDCVSVRYGRVFFESLSVPLL